MNPIDELLIVPDYYKDLKIKDKQLLKSRVFNAIDASNRTRAKKRLCWSKKTMLVSIMLSIIPLSGFAFVYAHLTWSGENFVAGRYPSGPASIAADPNYPLRELTASGANTFDLAASRLKAHFPIREPSGITGWNKIFSKGVVFPVHNYTVDQSHELKQTSVTESPLAYVDIYMNPNGQRIAVTQQYDLPQTVVLQNTLSRNTVYANPLGHVYDVGKNAQLMSGYGQDNLVYFISGSWAEDFPWAKSRKGNFENLLIFHREDNNTVTKIVIDEFGNVAPSVMQLFAHAYLNSSVVLRLSAR